MQRAKGSLRQESVHNPVLRMKVSHVLQVIAIAVCGASKRDKHTVSHYKKLALRNKPKVSWRTESLT